LHSFGILAYIFSIGNQFQHKPTFFELHCQLEPILILAKPTGGFFSESAMCFLDLQISKKKYIPKNYPELEICNGREI